MRVNSEFDPFLIVNEVQKKEEGSPVSQSFVDVVKPLFDDLDELVEPFGINGERVLSKASEVKLKVLNFWRSFMQTNPGSISEGLFRSDFAYGQEAIVSEILNNDETTFCFWGTVLNGKKEKVPYMEITVHSHPGSVNHNHLLFDMVVNGDKFSIKRTDKMWSKGRVCYQKTNTLEFENV